MTAPAQAGLYDGRGNPLMGEPAPERWQAVFIGRPICRVLLDPAQNRLWSGGNVHRQWAIDADPLPIAANVLADLVAVYDGGGIIAVVAPNARAAETAIGAVTALAGGWHA